MPRDQFSDAGLTKVRVLAGYLLLTEGKISHEGESYKSSINNKERKEETMSEAIERTQLHLRLSLDTYEKVKKKAQAKGMTVSNYIYLSDERRADIRKNKEYKTVLLDMIGG